MKDDYTINSRYITHTFLIYTRKVGRMHFLNLGVKGLIHLHADGAWLKKPRMKPSRSSRKTFLSCSSPHQWRAKWSWVWTQDSIRGASLHFYLRMVSARQYSATENRSFSFCIRHFLGVIAALAIAGKSSVCTRGRGALCKLLSGGVLLALWNPNPV